jgi:hypothetical protein
MAAYEGELSSPSIITPDGDAEQNCSSLTGHPDGFCAKSF